MVELDLEKLELINLTDLPDVSLLFTNPSDIPPTPSNSDPLNYQETVSTITVLLQEGWQNWALAQASLSTLTSFCVCAAHNPQTYGGFFTYSFAINSENIFETETHDEHKCSHCGGEIRDGKCQSCGGEHKH